MRPSSRSSVSLLQPSLLDLIDTAEYETAFKQYRNTFARDHRGPYAVQRPGKHWTTRHKSVSDPLLKAHLEWCYWVALKASWYPSVYILDVDAPAPGEIDHIINALGLKSGQYIVMTSPSYFHDGSCHILIMLEYNGKLPTHRLGYEALRNMVGRLCEVYPQLRRKCRLPFGRGQHFIGDDGRVLDFMPWWDKLHFVNKLDPVAIETFTYQQLLPFPSPIKDEDNPRIWAKQAEVRELFEHGLQAFGSRHLSLWNLAVSLWRNNWLPQDAIEHLKKWIRKKHNGFSQTATQGNWRVIDAEIMRQVQWIWTHFRPYPDTPHNLDAYATKDDLKWIAEVYPSDIVNQKRLFALASYMRPRARHDYVYVPFRIWREEIAHKDTYHAFRQDLENKGLLESVMSYRHVDGAPELSYSRRFKLKLPSTSADPIQTDGRNEHDYYEALRLTLGSVREMEAFTGVANQRFYQAFGRKRRLSGLE